MAFDSPFDETPATAEAPASSDQNYVTIILKGGKGYGAPSISIRGADIADALAQTERHKDELGKLIKVAADAGKYFGKLVDGEAGAAASSGPKGRPEGAAQAPNGESKSCAHGAMTFRSGTTKAGKPYRAFFCPSEDRDNQCKPEWLR